MEEVIGKSKDQGAAAVFGAANDRFRGTKINPMIEYPVSVPIITQAKPIKTTEIIMFSPNWAAIFCRVILIILYDVTRILYDVTRN